MTKHFKFFLIENLNIQSRILTNFSSIIGDNCARTFLCEKVGRRNRLSVETTSSKSPMNKNEPTPAPFSFIFGNQGSKFYLSIKSKFSVLIKSVSAELISFQCKRSFFIVGRR